MTADNRNSRGCLQLTAAVVVLAVAAANKTERTFATVAHVAPARTITFEGGETATVAADDTVYLTEEVAALNATAAAKGDYAYDDYDTSTDSVPRPFRGRFSPKPAKYALAIDATTSTATNATVATVTDAAASTVADAVSTANATVTTVADAVSNATVTTVADAVSTVNATVTTVADATATITETIITATAVAAATTTESGDVLAQIASPPGYDVSRISANVVSTTPMSLTVSSSLAASPCRPAATSATALQLLAAALAISSTFTRTML